MKLKRLILGILFLGLAGGGILSAGQLFFFAFAPSVPKSQESYIIEVRKGESPKEISEALASENVVSNPTRFWWLGRVTRQWGRIKAGEYKVSPAQSPMQLFQTITSGISVTRPLTIPEGENMYEISKLVATHGVISAETFLALCKDAKFIATLGFTPPAPPNLEGYLFPDTYFFNRSTQAEEMVRTMTKRFLEAWGPAEEERARSLGMTRQQAITLASMIEKETGAPGERPLISSVFHNRLKKKMRLQSDPTTIYGIWERYQGNLRKSDLLEWTAYNTYSIPALPVGPISNPGKEAIQAALYPASSEYLFFVSHNDGTHEFTSAYSDHSKAVQKFQIDRKAREGKSWRDLKKQ